jgi:hypothetical protein
MRSPFLILLVCISACSTTDSISPDALDIGNSDLDEDGLLQLETNRYSINLRIPQYGNPAALSDIRSYLQVQVDQLEQSVQDEPEPGSTGRPARTERSGRTGARLFRHPSI